MGLVPSSRPKMSKADVERILNSKGIDRTKFPVCVLAVRGYYLDTMGEKGKNDRGIFDDAVFVDSPTLFCSTNWNTDPSSYRKGSGTGSSKGMASLKLGAWDYQIGLHKGKGPAGNQAAKVTVVRDGVNGPYEDTGWFGINLHWGGAGTSSAGCQTAPKDQWQSFITPLVSELKRYGQKVFKYVLIDQAEMASILGSYISSPSNEAPKIELPVPSVITTGQDPDEGTESWYRRMFKACEVLPEKADQLKRTLKIIEGGLDQYFDVARRLGAHDIQNFAYILGAIHWKEASCDFRGVLHNGERIVGTGKKTTIVPKGRGPFATWADSAVDAIGIESSRWKKLIAGGQDIGDILYALERYNGTGYITGAGRSENSPYLWACSNINDGRGKYVADGKFDPNASTGATCGAALILKAFYNQGALEITV